MASLTVSTNMDSEISQLAYHYGEILKLLG